MISIKDINIFKKKILIRLDFDVPIKNNKIILDIKIKNSIQTIKYALDKNAYIILCSHLGNPNGIYINELSLEPIRKYLEKHLKIKIILIKSYLNGININNSNKEILLLENVRFNKGEIYNDDNLSKCYSNLCDIFVMDDFSSIDKIHSSTYGIMKFSKVSCSGLFFLQEYKKLMSFIKNIKKPLISIIGGTKIYKKIDILNKLSKISDYIFIGGSILNTLLKNMGYNIGKSLFENIYNYNIKNIIYNKKIILPIDFKVTNNINKFSIPINKNIEEINSNDIILDLGYKSINTIINHIKKSKTILWNGPIGIFEFKNFSKGTILLLDEIIKNNLISLFFGNNTIISLVKFNYIDKINYFYIEINSILKLIEKNDLPLLNILKKK